VDVLVVDDADADAKGREEVSSLEEVRGTELGNDYDLVQTPAGGAAKGRNEEEGFLDTVE
jgi:hypothetical protein